MIEAYVCAAYLARPLIVPAMKAIGVEVPRRWLFEDILVSLENAMKNA